MGSEEGIEMNEEFSGDGNEGEFFWFAAGDEFLEGGFKNRVATRGGESGHVEGAPELGPAAMDEAFF